MPKSWNYPWRNVIHVHTWCCSETGLEISSLYFGRRSRLGTFKSKQCSLLFLYMCSCFCVHCWWMNLRESEASCFHVTAALMHVFCVYYWESSIKKTINLCTERKWYITMNKDKIWMIESEIKFKYNIYFYQGNNLIFPDS